MYLFYILAVCTCALTCGECDGKDSCGWSECVHAYKLATQMLKCVALPVTCTVSLIVKQTLQSQTVYSQSTQ